MTITVVALLVYAVTVAGFLRYLRAITREHARERDLLTNKLLSLAGKPWVEPPALRDHDTRTIEEQRRAEEQRRLRVVSPEQQFE